MNIFSEYAKYDATGLAKLVRDKHVTSSELVETAISFIEKINPDLNAVISPMYEEGRRVAALPLPVGPFSGVPFLLKDWLTTYKGMPYSQGCRALIGHKSKADSELMLRYRSTGLVTIGKTNTSEFGFSAITEPLAFGPTSTPWDIRYNAGGSSGGSAAAVASGMVPMASGGDGGGSLRIPSSCCGTFGFKPSRGLTSISPYGEVWQGAACEHVITRSVRDSAQMLDAISGQVLGGFHNKRPTQCTFLSETKTPPRKLRIGFSIASPLGTPVHIDCEKAVLKTVQVLQELGHEVEEAHPQYNGKSVAQSFMMMYFGEAAAEIKNLKKYLGRRITQKDVEPLTWTLSLLGNTYTAGDFVEHKKVWNQVAQTMGNFHQNYDVFLCPTIATPPPLNGAYQPTRIQGILMKIVNSLQLGKMLKNSGIVEQLVFESFAKMPFTQLSNITGQPAMSLPLYWNDDNLPIGLHFMAAVGNDKLLFKLAAQLEKTVKWRHRKPPVFAKY